MKTTENISIAGYAFTIETDAYEALGTYINDIRTCITDDSSREEIVSDIEERIAELLNEKCNGDVVVNIRMIYEIKERIGNPELLSQEDVESPAPQEEQENPQQKSWRSKRMYRNMEERIVGGVCAGLGSYFGLDKVFFRLIFIVFFLIGFLGIDDGPYFGFSILAYICLWIAMPAARTVEQKCEMKGKPMNIRGFKSKDFNFEKEVKDVAQSPVGQTAKRAGGVFLGIMLLLVGLSGMLGSIFIPSLPAIIGHEIADEIIDFDAGEQMMADILTGGTFWGLIMVMLGIGFIWFIYNGVMLLFDLKTASWRPGLILFIAWLISIFVVVAWVIKTVADTLPLII